MFWLLFLAFHLDGWPWHYSSKLGQFALLVETSDTLIPKALWKWQRTGSVRGSGITENDRRTYTAQSKLGPNKKSITISIKYVNLSQQSPEISYNKVTGNKKILQKCTEVINVVQWKELRENGQIIGKQTVQAKQKNKYMGLRIICLYSSWIFYAHIFILLYFLPQIQYRHIHKYDTVHRISEQNAFKYLRKSADSVQGKYRRQRGSLKHTSTTRSNITVFVNWLQLHTRSPAIDEKELIVCVVWNSHAACWQWLFQIWKFCRFICSQYGFNLFARWHQRLWFRRWGVWGNRVSVGC